MLTEAEAKTKWCPFVRYDAGGGGDPSANRWKQSLPKDEPDALNPVACRCIGSDCMAWRKQETREFHHDAELEFRKTGRRMESDTGFCGLAGKP